MLEGNAPEEVLDLVERFERNLDAYRSEAYNETRLRREFIDPFFSTGDLGNFQPALTIFRFSDLRSGRIMERLDRKLGQRRDATRAPIQARNGWRPSGRLLVSPLHHLRTGNILSKRWGPPHTETLGVVVWESWSHSGSSLDLPCHQL